MLKNSSEMLETVQRFERLLAHPIKAAPPASSREPDFALKPSAVIPASEPPAPVVAPLVPTDFSGLNYTDEKLSLVLDALVRRGQFTLALLLDNEALPLAQAGAGKSNEVMPALSSVLGTALHRIGELMGSQSVAVISADLDLLDKAVLTRFSIAASTLYLLIVCPQDQDVREEAELALGEIRSILHREDAQ